MYPEKHRYTEIHDLICVIVPYTVTGAALSGGPDKTKAAGSAGGTDKGGKYGTMYSVWRKAQTGRKM